MSIQSIIELMRTEPCDKVAQSKLRKSEMDRLDKIVAELDVTRSKFIRACILAGMDDVEKMSK
jgi:hypothetical protein